MRTKPAIPTQKSRLIGESDGLKEPSTYITSKHLVLSVRSELSVLLAQEELRGLQMLLVPENPLLRNTGTP